MKLWKFVLNPVAITEFPSPDILSAITYENDAQYLERKRAKQRLYQQYELNLIEIVDENVRDLDDFLPRMLLKFGVKIS
ncbi:MAG: hypothetical protein AB4290_15605 [Spirulina sp.]